MLRKLQMNDKDLGFVFIPKAYIELLHLSKGQKMDVRVVNKKIMITPIPISKIETGALPPKK